MALKKLLNTRVYGTAVDTTGAQICAHNLSWLWAQHTQLLCNKPLSVWSFIMTNQLVINRQNAVYRHQKMHRQNGLKLGGSFCSIHGLWSARSRPDLFSLLYYKKIIFQTLSSTTFFSYFISSTKVQPYGTFTRLINVSMVHNWFVKQLYL